MKKFKTVFKFTYLWNLKSTGFIVATIIGVILVALSMNINVLKDKILGDSSEIIAICDYDNNFSLKEETLNDIGFKDCNFKEVEKSDIEDIKKGIKEGKAEEDYLITRYSQEKETIEVFSKSTSNSEKIKNITSYLKTMYISSRAESSELDPQILNNLMSDVPIELIDSDEDKEGNMILVYFLILILFIMIFFYGMDVLNSVVEEKNNRIMETLITMSNPLELFFGKVFGVCAVTLTQLTIFTIAGTVFVNLNSDILDFLSQFNVNLDLKLICYLLVFIILGYLLYAFIFAALGSLVSSTQDSTQAVMPLTFFVLAIMMAGLMSLTNLDSTFAKVCSFIPFSSPIFMFERAIISEVPVVQVIISIVILIVSILIVGWGSSKVYKRGILHYGKKASYFKILLNKK